MSVLLILSVTSSLLLGSAALAETTAQTTSKTNKATSNTQKKNATTSAASAAPSATPEPEEKAPIPAPFQSEEDIEYTAGTKDNFLGFSKTEEFIGILNRPFASRKDLAQADVYYFPKSRNLVIDALNCEKVAEKIVGPLKTISLKHEKTEIYKSTFGSACELSLTDPDTQALSRERRLYILNVKKDVYAFYFHFAKKTLPSDSTDIRGFLRGLK